MGAHMSAAGGLVRAVERAVAVGCRALQVFTKNSNQWTARPLAPAEGTSFREAAAAAGIAPLVSHAAYLINLGSSDPVVRSRSVEALVDELERCETAGIPFLVLHPGTHGGDGVETGVDRIARGLDEALERTQHSDARVLLETSAGQGASVGHTFGELASILGRTEGRSRVGICLDTCHLHAAGFDLVSREGWARTLGELDTEVGLGLVEVVHANDSKGPRGCRLDRHERIGLGALGLRAFENLMTEPALLRVPKILETPKDETGLWDREGLAALRRCARRGVRSRRS